MLYQEARTRKEGLRVNASEEMVSISYTSSRSPKRVPNLSGVQNEARLDALRRDPNFIQYIAKLEHTTYFEGELKDSEEWKKREHQAAQTWITMRQAE